jgi:hypothetical protein
MNQGQIDSSAPLGKGLGRVRSFFVFLPSLAGPLWFALFLLYWFLLLPDVLRAWERPFLSFYFFAGWLVMSPWGLGLSIAIVIFAAIFSFISQRSVTKTLPSRVFMVLGGLNIIVAEVIVYWSLYLWLNFASHRVFL